MVLFYTCCQLRLGGGSRARSLHEVVLHIALEVEVGELVTGLDVEELGKVGIRVDLAAIGGVLETLGADVAVDLLVHLRARHLSTGGLAKELGELVADKSGLHEARGLAVRVGLALLGGRLLGVLDLTGHNLLKVLEITADRGEKAAELLHLGGELSHLHTEGAVKSISGLGGGNCSGSGSLHGSGLRLGLLSTRLDGSLLDNNIFNGGGGGGLLRIGSDHSYILLMIYFFKCFNAKYILLILDRKNELIMNANPKDFFNGQKKRTKKMRFLPFFHFFRVSSIFLFYYSSDRSPISHISSAARAVLSKSFLE